MPWAGAVLGLAVEAAEAAVEVMASEDVATPVLQSSRNMSIKLNLQDKLSEGNEKDNDTEILQ